MLAGKGHFSLSKLSHVFRGGNKAADCLAAYGHTHSDSILFNSLGSLPFDSKKPVHSQGMFFFRAP